MADLRERKVQLHRSHADPWTLPDILAGVAQQCAAYLSTCKIRGNVNGVDAFAGVNLGDISSAASNAADLTDPAKLGRFISQTIQAEAPTSLALVPTQLLPALGSCQEPAPWEDG
ncbi:hypothetical protein BJ546DRAFT_946212 [Cryomyces antarcticus]